MDHEEARLACSRSSEDGLAPAAQAALDSHLSQCADCRAFSASLLRSLDLLAVAAGRAAQTLLSSVLAEARLFGHESAPEAPGWAPAAQRRRGRVETAAERAPGELAAAEEARLVQWARAGDADAFGELVRRDSPLAYAQALALARNPDDAWDLAAESYRKAWAAILGFKGDARFSTWRHAILHRAFLDFRAKESRKRGNELPMSWDAADPESSAPQFADPAPGPEQRALEDEGRALLERRVAAALARLHPVYRFLLRAVHLRKRRKGCYAAIARYLGLAARAAPAAPTLAARDDLDAAALARLRSEIQSRNAYDLKLLHAREAFARAFGEAPARP